MRPPRDQPKFQTEDSARSTSQHGVRMVRAHIGQPLHVLCGKDGLWYGAKVIAKDGR